MLKKSQIHKKGKYISSRGPGLFTRVMPKVAIWLMPMMISLVTMALLKEILRWGVKRIQEMDAPPLTTTLPPLPTKS
jgi:hypothetical protein